MRLGTGRLDLSGRPLLPRPGSPACAHRPGHQGHVGDAAVGPDRPPVRLLPGHRAPLQARRVLHLAVGHHLLGPQRHGQHGRLHGRQPDPDPRQRQGLQHHLWLHQPLSVRRRLRGVPAGSGLRDHRDPGRRRRGGRAVLHRLRPPQAGLSAPVSVSQPAGLQRRRGRGRLLDGRVLHRGAAAARRRPHGRALRLRAGQGLHPRRELRPACVRPELRPAGHQRRAAGPARAGRQRPHRPARCGFVD